MTTKNFLKLLLLVTLTFILTKSIMAQEDWLKEKPRTSLQINALEFVGKFYSIVYTNEFKSKSHLMLGLSYENPRYDFGTTHAYAIIIGYRRYLWKDLNVEYALWPAYNSFYEKNEQKYYNGLELWGEFRIGYDFTLKIGKTHWFVMPQFILGKGLIKGNKPQSFKDYYKNEEHFFVAPNIALGIDF
ncbi:MAG: hypothetical protein AB7S48_02680 [Bacteroidales bacterium]